MKTGYPLLKTDYGLTRTLPLLAKCTATVSTSLPKQENPTDTLPVKAPIGQTALPAQGSWAYLPPPMAILATKPIACTIDTDETTRKNISLVKDLIACMRCLLKPLYVTTKSCSITNPPLFCPIWLRLNLNQKSTCSSKIFIFQGEYL